MCKTAASNGLKTAGLASNCNVPPQIRHNKNFIPQEYIFQKKLQFVALEEKPFILNESNSQFVFMTTIRNPTDRVVSHLHHEFCGQGGAYSKEEVTDRLLSHLCLSRPRTLSDLIADPCFSAHPMNSITTDYYLAMFTGCKNRKSDGNHGLLLSPADDKTTCSEVHLEEAKRMLNYFSVILISDNSADFDR
jgi:hypothetical protein